MREPRGFRLTVRLVPVPSRDELADCPDPEKEWLRWCRRYGIRPLGGDRRGWCDTLSTYVRDACCVAEHDGQPVLLLYPGDDNHGCEPPKPRRCKACDGPFTAEHPATDVGSDVYHLERESCRTHRLATRPKRWRLKAGKLDLSVKVWAPRTPCRRRPIPRGRF